MSLVSFMAHYSIFMKELRHRHPNVLFLSYVDDILFVARVLHKVKRAWASVEGIGRIVGLRAYLDKMELYHCGGGGGGEADPLGGKTSEGTCTIFRPSRALHGCPTL